MKIKTAGVLVAVGTLLAGCQTTGLDNSALIGAATQVAVASAAPSAASAAPAASLAQDPVAIAAVQQQAARQGMTLTAEQAATAIAMQQSGASGASLQNAALQNAAVNGGAALAGQQIAQAAMTTATTTTTNADTATAALAPAGTPDGMKSCEQLSAEIAQQQQVIADANASSTNAQIVDAGLGIAQSVGMHFGGFGLGGIQATGAASSVANQQKQSADEQVQQAEIRVQVLSGIHQGKGC
ncbi:hypothetical protein [Parvibaculum sp.]|uniref:hypothetical protein n=1 Tax=Parvibaculum sp. TaxID=2024848 RepID=UPI001B112302|nr:hypothetical protein [Parvibaculum sp.]MBO6632982.1 hypothetical protein [Parvibaculum sp.]MBO6679411.1 hypothetical protein [Parvibaculum sp.]MBO6684442.1 hypothetical protein [Parvibaculum sp.]